MPANDDSPLLNVFDQRVTGFQTKHFALAEDLEWLDRHRRLRAPVAVILHCTRILEVLAREALAQSGLPVHAKDSHAPTLEFVLKELMHHHRLSQDTYVLLKSLRDLGNQARHALRRMSVPDAEQGYAIILCGLQWFFCEFPNGDKLKCLNVYNQSLDSLLPFDVATLLGRLESAKLSERDFLDTLQLKKPECQLLQSPVFVAVLAEKLLDGKRDEQARVILSAALERFPDDVRLRQLQGLLWSRAGRLEEACGWLEAIEATDSAADEETQGILAGAYKRRADLEPNRREEWLRASYEKYARGWRQSQNTNTYLGINAAALALWLRLPGKTAPIARGVRTRLQTRRHGLMQAENPGPRFLNYWDQLTLAEAHLLLQQWDAARQCYAEAAQRFPGQAKAHEVAREQARKNLAALGRPDAFADIFPS